MRYISLANAHKVIRANPEVTHILVGPPGIGKTKGLYDIFPRETHTVVIVDAANSDVGDTSLPSIKEKVQNGETISVVEFIPAARYGLGILDKDGKPRIPVVVIDEIGKAPGHTRGMFNRAMYDRMIGDTPLPEGSIVIGTSNSLNDGLGDSLEGHTLNRVCILNVRPSTEAEWTQWAESHGIHPILIKFASYRTTAGDGLFDYYGDLPDPRASTNCMVFNPHLENAGGSFVSPRSLAQADGYFRAAFDPTHHVSIDDDVLLIALEGLWGAAAANAFQEFLLVDGRKLPTLDKLRKEYKEVLSSLQGEIRPLAPLAMLNLLDQVGRAGAPTASSPHTEAQKDAWIKQTVADLELVSGLILELNVGVIAQICASSAVSRPYAWSTVRHNKTYPANKWKEVNAMTAATNSALTSAF